MTTTQPLNKGLQRVYIVRSKHPTIPGEPMTAHATKDAAEDAALELMNLIREDLDLEPLDAFADFEGQEDAQCELAERDQTADVWVLDLLLMT